MASAAVALPTLAACAPQTPPPPGQQQAPAATGQPGSAPAPGGLKEVPRNRTLHALGYGREGKYTDYELWNLYAVGATHKPYGGILFEPLAYYTSLADKEILWLAESYKFNADNTELVIKTRQNVKWSDGTPFSAEDVAYTLETLRTEGAKLKWGVEVQMAVESVKATDANTVTIKFKVPSPRFFYFMTYKFDSGVWIVPKHIYQGQDWTTFKNFDIAKGLPLTTGPWKLVWASAEQKVIDRRDEEWWAEKAGLAKKPRIERIVYRPHAGEQQAAQSLITNDADWTRSMVPATLQTIFKQNPKVTTHTGQNPPFGFLDFWDPWSLYVHHEKPPLNDRDVRWALSYFIDRKQIVDVSYSGASDVFPMPFPNYPGLKPYFDATKPLLEKYNTLEFNPKKGEELLTKKGWKKDGQGFWVDANGKRLQVEILGWIDYGGVVEPVVTEMLRRQGVDATFILPPDYSDRTNKQAYQLAISAHAGSLKDPYDTMYIYYSTNPVNLSRWKNPEYDKIVDQVGRTSMDDKGKLVDLWVKAMEIWLPELPDILLTEQHQRLPMNTTYWKNWPTAENPYVPGSFWHLHSALTYWNLEPV